MERPLRLVVDLGAPSRAKFHQACKEIDDEPLAALVDRLAGSLGPGPHSDFNLFLKAVEQDSETHNVKLTGQRLKLLQTALGRKDPRGVSVIKKIHKRGRAQANPMSGLFEVNIGGKLLVVEYEPDSELRDTEQIPLLEDGGIEIFLGVKSCHTRQTPGLTTQPPKSATRFLSPDTFTNRCSYALLRRSAKISRWRKRMAKD